MNHQGFTYVFKAVDSSKETVYGYVDAVSLSAAHYRLGLHGLTQIVFPNSDAGEVGRADIRRQVGLRVERNVGEFEGPLRITSAARREFVQMSAAAKGNPGWVFYVVLVSVLLNIIILGIQAGLDGMAGRGVSGSARMSLS